MSPLIHVKVGVLEVKLQANVTGLYVTVLAVTVPVHVPRATLQ